MKIIQFLGKLPDHGCGLYVIELHNALKKIGHDVEIVHMENGFDHTIKIVQQLPAYSTLEYGQELFDKLNSADIVLINANVHHKASDEDRTHFYDAVLKIDKPIKVIFCNDHNISHYKTYINEFSGGEKGLDFVKHIDKFVTFSPFNKVFEKIKSLYPDIIKKYVHLQHPYEFSEPYSRFVPFEDKYKRVSYFGRFSRIKDPMFLLRQQQDFIDNGYQLEMRGMVRTFTMAFTPGFIYEFEGNDTSNKTLSTRTLDLLTKKALRELYPNENPNLIHLNDRDINKIYLLGPYMRNDGMEAMRYSQFSVDLINIKNPIAAGNNVEYVVAEAIDSGTIPLLNYDWMEHCRIYDKNSKLTDKTAMDFSCGMCVKKDGSNIAEVMKQMNELSSNKEAYDKYRKECFDFYKEMFDPVKVATRFINDITNPDNFEALSEFDITI